MSARSRSAPSTRWRASSGSARSTASTVTAPPAAAIASVRPRQRSSSDALPTSWFTHSTARAPAAASRSPPACAASYSFTPTCASRPVDCQNASPALIETIGMPAASAARSGAPSASPSGIVTMSALGRDATAASISSPMRTMSKLVGAWYSRRTPRSSAASDRPFETTDQNASDDWPCVTATMRTSAREPRAVATGFGGVVGGGPVAAARADERERARRSREPETSSEHQSGPSPHGPQTANVMLGFGVFPDASGMLSPWILKKSTRPSGL